MSLNNYGYCVCCIRTDTMLWPSERFFDKRGDEYFECPTCRELPDAKPDPRVVIE